MTTRRPLSAADLAASAARIREQASRILAAKSATFAKWEKYRAELEARDNFLAWVKQGRDRQDAYRRKLSASNHHIPSKTKTSP